MSPNPDTWMMCDDTPFEHWQCGLRSSDNCYRFAEAEKHFRRALELIEERQEGASVVLADVLISYAGLLLKMKRPHEAVALYERRLSLKRFRNEDRLERRCTAEHFAALKEHLAKSNGGQ